LPQRATEHLVTFSGWPSAAAAWCRIAAVADGAEEEDEAEEELRGGGASQPVSPHRKHACSPSVHCSHFHVWRHPYSVRHTGARHEASVRGAVTPVRACGRARAALVDSGCVTLVGASAHHNAHHAATTIVTAHEG
jgi:hypothetical protein